MKKTVFTIIAVLVLSSTTSFAQRYGGRMDTQVNSSVKQSKPTGNKRNDMHKGNNVHIQKLMQPIHGKEPHTVHNTPAPVVYHAPAPVVHHTPAPIVHHVPVIPHPAPVIVEPAPRPPHVVHTTVSPAGFVVGAVVGTVIGALLCN